MNFETQETYTQRKLGNFTSTWYLSLVRCVQIYEYDDVHMIYDMKSKLKIQVMRAKRKDSELIIRKKQRGEKELDK
jgi:hypothetical protein